MRAVSECGWGSGSLGCEHRLCGSSVATRGHLARRMTPRDNRFRAEEPEPPSCRRHTSEGPSEKPGQSHSLFPPPRPCAAVQEAFKHPMTADRKARSTGSLWREVGGGVSSRPPHSHPTSSTPHKLHQLPLCAGVHSVDGPEGGRKLFSFLGGQPSELKPPFVHQLPKLTLKNTSQCGFKWFSVILSSFQ